MVPPDGHDPDRLSRAKRAYGSDREAEPGAGRRGRVRAPAAAGASVAAAIYGLLPDSLILGPRLVVPCLEVGLIVAVMVTNPHRSDHHSGRSL